MTTVAPPPAEWAQARGAVYGLLARALAYPEPEHRAEMAALAESLASMRAGLSLTARALVGMMPAEEERRAQYTRLFSHSTSRDFPMFETAYTAKELFRQTEEMADIAGFYRAFGVEAAPGAERVDHISAELEFMGFLAAKEAYARSGGSRNRVRQCRHAERLFLRDHLGGWAQALGGRLEQADPDGWYGQIGVLLRLWLAEECRGLRVRPVILQPQETPAWPHPDDEVEGPDDSDPGAPLPLPVLQV